MQNETTNREVAMSTEKTEEQAAALTLRLPAQTSLAPRSLTEAMESAKLIAASGLCPAEYRGKPQDVLAAIVMGAELGVTPFQSLQNIAVINGRPTMWGDLVLAIVRRSGIMEYIREREPDEADQAEEGRCEVKRVGDAEPVIRRFTVQMADDAGLIKRSGTSGPWATYRGRMLQMRARSWALRDAFPDVLKGLQLREEVEDYPEEPSGPKVIHMPQRASESAAVDEFLKGTQASTPASAPRRESPGTQNGGQKFLGFVDRIEEKSGKSDKGRPWTLYTIHTTDGESFGTFDTAHRDLAITAREGGAQVEIEWTVTAKGNKNVSTIRIIEE